MSTYDNWTVAQARKHLIDNRKKGTTCLVCDRRAKVYRRVLGGSMCYVLILLYRRFKMYGSEWVHVVDFLSTVPLQGDGDKLRAKLIKGDWPKLRWWGLIYEKPYEVKPDGNPSAGFWSITEAGVKFAEQQMKLPCAAFEFRSQLMDWDVSEYVNIKEALKKQFDYDELMKY